MALLFIGLADPHIALDQTKAGVNVVLAIDDSGSMQASDYQPTRLEAAGKNAADTLIKNARGERLCRGGDLRIRAQQPRRYCAGPDRAGPAENGSGGTKAGTRPQSATVSCLRSTWPGQYRIRRVWWSFSRTV
ncbi:MAG: VWA domain-containing protein [Desulfobacterales bacterium]|nr:VWA domain-containing protein [Desulfobacterales bacterium]